MRAGAEPTHRNPFALELFDRRDRARRQKYMIEMIGNCCGDADVHSREFCRDRLRTLRHADEESSGYQRLHQQRSAADINNLDIEPVAAEGSASLSNFCDVVIRSGAAIRDTNFFESLAGYGSSSRQAD